VYVTDEQTLVHAVQRVMPNRPQQVNFFFSSLGIAFVSWQRLVTPKFTQHLLHQQYSKSGWRDTLWRSTRPVYSEPICGSPQKNTPNSLDGIPTFSMLPTLKEVTWTMTFYDSVFLQTRPTRLQLWATYWVCQERTTIQSATCCCRSS